MPPTPRRYGQLVRLTASAIACSRTCEAPSAILLREPEHFLLTPQATEVAWITDFGDASVGGPSFDFAALTAEASQHLPAVLAGR